MSTSVSTRAWWRLRQVPAITTASMLAMPACNAAAIGSCAGHRFNARASMTTRSACMPGARWPTRSDNPRARAPWTVAQDSACLLVGAAVAALRPVRRNSRSWISPRWRARVIRAAVRTSPETAVSVSVPSDGAACARSSCSVIDVQCPCPSSFSGVDVKVAPASTRRLTQSSVRPVPCTMLACGPHRPAAPTAPQPLVGAPALWCIEAITPRSRAARRSAIATSGVDNCGLLMAIPSVSSVLLAMGPSRSRSTSRTSCGLVGPPCGVPCKKTARIPAAFSASRPASVCAGVRQLWHQSPNVVVPQLIWFKAPTSVPMYMSSGRYRRATWPWVWARYSSNDQSAPANRSAVCQVCRWALTSPGMTMRSVRSTTSAPVASRRSPIMAMRLPSMRMSMRSVSGRLGAMVTTCAPRNRIRVTGCLLYGLRGAPSALV
ncbi:Uncharacterised protein [Mycobacteroides abscessus subsp. abscessus]|nr:Uncharacterised protein [Mycobacteroides abscessus subsp. abscessus]